MSTVQSSISAGYKAAKFTTFFPRKDASPDTVRWWIRSWFSNRGLKSLALEASTEKIAWDGNDIRAYNRSILEYDLHCWDFGYTYSRMVVADIQRARELETQLARHYLKLLWKPIWIAILFLGVRCLLVQLGIAIV